jgi:cytochrome c peroxidase
MKGQRIRNVALSVALASATFVACSSEPTVDGFTDAQWTQIHSLSPLPDVQADPTNQYADNAQAATLGQRLFFDKAFSGPIIADETPAEGGNGMMGQSGKIACANCHQPANWMMDRRSIPNNTALGTQWMIRNAATAINSSFYKVWCEKDGVRDSQWSDSLTDPEDPTSMNGSRLLVAHVLYAKYKDQYNALFPTPLDPDLDPTSPNAARFPANGKPKGDPTLPDGPWEMMAPADQKIVMTIFANFGKAIQAYVRLLVSRNAPFDQYAAGNYSVLNASEKNGLNIFIGKANCIGCHSGPLFSDSKFHDTGLGAAGIHIDPDETGRYDAVPAVLSCEFNSNTSFSDDTSSHRLDGLTQTESQIGQWRTTQLRTVAQTAPYMHTGQLATLKDVLDFYNQVMGPMAAPKCPSGPPVTGHAPCYLGTIDMLMKPLNLADSEEQDVVNFLGTLTGDPLPSALTQDTSAP